MFLSKCEVCDVKNPNLCMTAWRFTYSSCGLFTKKKQKTKKKQNLQETGDAWYSVIYLSKQTRRSIWYC